MTKFLIGADPEIFVIDREGQGISAHAMIPGSKKDPFPVDNGAIQPDGVAAEFNITPVPLGMGGKEYLAFDANVTSVIRTLTEYVRKDDEARTLKIASVMDFDPEYIDALPEEAKALGCDPDFNAYTLQPNPTPDAMAPFRTAAGHIHVGWGANIPANHEDHVKICADFIKIMDATVGLYMTVIDKDGTRRRELYGKAGAFRPKPYGVEYRTPSNAWISSTNRRRSVFEWTHFATIAASNGYTIKKLLDISEPQLQRIINEGDFKAAKTLLDRVAGRLYAGDSTCYRSLQTEYATRMKEEQGEAAPIAPRKEPTPRIKKAAQEVVFN